jgi:formylglycine-generating enzyme required for sulfatase activity
MAWVPGGTFTMGSDSHYPEEAPAQAVTVAGVWMDRAPVTNREFRRFVEETGHVTLAERAPIPDDYPDADPALLAPGSAVFRPPARPVPLDDAYAWWAMVPGASWRHPRGPQSGLRGMDDHPVVHVAPTDAEAYCRWAGKRAIKGGSHLCAANYCRRYRPAARLAQLVDTTTSHVGFRCVLRAPRPAA